MGGRCGLPLDLWPAVIVGRSALWGRAVPAGIVRTSAAAVATAIAAWAGLVHVHGELSAEDSTRGGSDRETGTRRNCGAGLMLARTLLPQAQGLPMVIMMCAWQVGLWIGLGVCEQEP